MPPLQSENESQVGHQNWASNREAGRTAVLGLQPRPVREPPTTRPPQHARQPLRRPRCRLTPRPLTRSARPLCSGTGSASSAGAVGGGWNGGLRCAARARPGARTLHLPSGLVIAGLWPASRARHHGLRRRSGPTVPEATRTGEPVRPTRGSERALLCRRERPGVVASPVVTTILRARRSNLRRSSWDRRD